jgi:hypothetical protein
MSRVSFRPVSGPPPDVTELSRRLRRERFDDAKPEPSGRVWGRSPDEA